MDNKERKIGETLRNQRFDLNKDELWDQIAGSLPKEKDKRRGFLWLFLLLIPISIGAYLMNLDDPMGNEKEHQEEIIMDNNMPLLVDENLIADKNEETPDVVHQHQTFEVKSHIDNKEIEKNKITLNSKIPAFPFEKPINNFENQDNQEASYKNKVVELLNFPELSKISPLLQSEARSLPELEHTPFTVPIGKVHQKWSLTILGGANKSFTNVIGSIDRESGLYGGSFTALLDYKLKKRWSVSGGITFDQLVTRYSDRRTVRTKASTNSISEIKIDALGNSESIEGPVEITKITQRDIHWHRRQNSIDLQLNIKKDIVLTQHWKVGLVGGIAYNLASKTDGFAYNLNEAFDFYKMEDDQAHFYRTQTGLKPLGGVEVNYKYRNIELIALVQYKWNINPINTQIENYQIKHSQTGIQLGTRYYLNGN